MPQLHFSPSQATSGPSGRGRNLFALVRILPFLLQVQSDGGRGGGVLASPTIEIDADLRFSREICQSIKEDNLSQHPKVFLFAFAFCHACARLQTSFTMQGHSPCGAEALRRPALPRRAASLLKACCCARASVGGPVFERKRGHGYGPYRHTSRPDLALHAADNW